MRKPINFCTSLLLIFTFVLSVVPCGPSFVSQVNGWTKYGCGNNSELQEQFGELLRKRYPYDYWTQKLADEEDSDK
ncbi:MAG: hypothetical protein ACRD6X_09825 [Pyrinomonadaceae bacterium]